MQRTDDLVMHLDLEETSGTSAPDTSPGGVSNNGTLTNGAAYVPGAGHDGGSAVDLDGANDLIAIADSVDSAFTAL